MSTMPSGGGPPTSTAAGADEAIDWSTRPDGGLAEFRASRARLLESLRVDSEIHRLERAWTLPAAPRGAGG